MKNRAVAEINDIARVRVRVRVRGLLPATSHSIFYSRVGQIAIFNLGLGLGLVLRFVLGSGLVFRVRVRVRLRVRVRVRLRFRFGLGLGLGEYSLRLRIPFSIPRLMQRVRHQRDCQGSLPPQMGEHMPVMHACPMDCQGCHVW